MRNIEKWVDMNRLPDMFILDFCEWLMEQRHCYYHALMEYVSDRNNLDEINEYIDWYVEEYPDKHASPYELKDTFRFSDEQVRFILHYQEIMHTTAMGPPIRLSLSEEVPMYIELDFLEWIAHNQRVDLFDFEKCL